MSANTLSVYMGADLIGTLHNSEPLAFSYDPSWLTNKRAKPLSDQIPLAEGRNDTPHVYAFFENLLPEGEQRKLIHLKSHVTSVFGMLATVGGDTAGSIALLPPGQQPAPPLYKKTTWQEINKLIHADGEEIEACRRKLENGLPKPRLSISGAQFKLLVSIDDDGSPLYPMGATPSTHIVKPDINHGAVKLFATAVNEAIIMQAAHLCGLPSAKVFYQSEIQAAMVERYDRVKQPDGSLKKLWQADFCQLLGVPSGTKYEHDGGPTFEQCYNLVRNRSVQQAADLRMLLRWLFFNLYVGNHDSHAKNLSMMATDDGLRLAPFYDLMCTRVYPGLSKEFALSIGGEFMPGKIGKEHIEKLADTLGIKTSYLLNIAKQTAKAVTNAMPRAVGMIEPHVGHKEKIMAERIQQTISSITRKSLTRFLGMNAEPDAENANHEDADTVDEGDVVR